MNWLEKIRNKPTEQKMRLIWIIVAISAVILIILWILTSRIPAHTKKDITLFQTIGQGFKNLKEQYKK